MEQQHGHARAHEGAELQFRRQIAEGQAWGFAHGMHVLFYPAAHAAEVKAWLEDPEDSALALASEDLDLLDPSISLKSKAELLSWHVENIDQYLRQSYGVSSPELWRDFILAYAKGQNFPGGAEEYLDDQGYHVQSEQFIPNEQEWSGIFKTSGWLSHSNAQRFSAWVSDRLQGQPQIASDA